MFLVTLYICLLVMVESVTVFKIAMANNLLIQDVVSRHLQLRIHDDGVLVITESEKFELT